MKKTLLRIAFCLFLAVFTVMAATSCESKGLEFHLLDDDTYEVIGMGECDDLDIVIPSEHEGKAVTRIDNSAFEGCDDITSVVIPDSVTSIGSGAFDGCEELTEITIPDSVTQIGSSAFADCKSLTRVNITDLGAWNEIPKFFIIQRMNIDTTRDSITRKFPDFGKRTLNSVIY